MVPQTIWYVNLNVNLNLFNITITYLTCMTVEALPTYLRSKVSSNANK